MDNMDNKDNKNNKQIEEYNKGSKAIREYREDENRYYKQPKSNMLKKQTIIIVLCLIVIGGLTGTYFAVLAPMVEESLKAPEKEKIPLLEGEELGVTDRIMITPKVERKDTKNVYVKNKVDEYRVIHHLGEDIYYVEGAELAPIHQENLVSFYTNVTYLLSMTRVAGKDIEDGNEILADLEQFGFNDDSSYFIVTKTDDTYYKIIIGDKIPTTGGYYVMYEDENGRRDAIYIIDTAMEENVLTTKYSLLMPTVSTPVNMMTESIYIDNFRFYKGADLFVEIYNGDIPSESDYLVYRQMRYPAPYKVSDNYSTLLNTFSNFEGIQVVYAMGIDEIEEGLSEELLTEYGFDENMSRIMFDYNDKEYYYIFSSPNEAGNYYVFSMEFYTIIEVSPDVVPFLEWDLIKFVDRPIFSENINDVSEITIKSPGKTDVVFNIEIVSKDEETGRVTEIEIKGNGRVLDMPNPDAHPTQKVDKAWNFRQYYKSILSIYIQDWDSAAEIGESEKIDETDKNAYDDSNPLLEMIISKRNGEVNHYKFYFVPGNTRRSFFTINGSGDFYVLRDKINKLINDTERVMQNLIINADAAE